MENILSMENDGTPLHEAAKHDYQEALWALITNAAELSASVDAAASPFADVAALADMLSFFSSEE